MRVIIMVQGALMAALGVGLFIFPTAFASLWPWQLTPLTARAVGAWLIGLGIAALHAAWENDWSRGQAAAAGYVTLGILELIELARFAGTLDWGSLTTWVYLLFLFSVLAVGVYGLIRLRGHSPAT